MCSDRAAAGMQHVDRTDAELVRCQSSHVAAPRVEGSRSTLPLSISCRTIVATNDLPISRARLPRIANVTGYSPVYASGTPGMAPWMMYPRMFSPQSKMSTE